MPAMPTTSRKMHSYKSHHACRDDGGCQQFFAWALLPQPSCLPWWLSACNEQLSCRKAVGCHFSVSFWSLTLHKWMQGPTWGAKPPMNSLGKEGHCHWARGLNFSGDEPPHQPTNLENLISKKGFNFLPMTWREVCSLNPGQFESVSASKNRKSPCQGESKMSKEQVYHFMCNEGYVGDDCSKCAESHGKADYNPLTCLKCPTSPWRSQGS